MSVLWLCFAEEKTAGYGADNRHLRLLRNRIRSGQGKRPTNSRQHVLWSMSAKSLASKKICGEEMNDDESMYWYWMKEWEREFKRGAMGRAVICFELAMVYAPAVNDLWRPINKSDSRINR